MLKLLIARQADVEFQDFEGSTPLHYALRQSDNHIEAVRFLLGAGADPNSQNNYGYTPLNSAIIRKCYACVELLLGKSEFCIKSK